MRQPSAIANDDRGQDRAQAALGIAAGERPIASIKIGARHRHDLGDIDSLAASPGGEL